MLFEQLELAGVRFELEDGGDGFEYDGPAEALTDTVLEALHGERSDILRELARRKAANDSGPGLELVSVPFTPAELARIPSGSLYVEPSPDASPTHAREASRPGQLPPTVRVSHIERSRRHRLAKMRDDERHCAACKARGPAEGPLPFAWDVHALPGAAELVLSCSPACRAALGYRERKLQ